MLKISKPLSRKEAEEASKPMLLPDGYYLARILDALERLSKNNRPMIVLRTGVSDAAGNERELPVYLNDSRMGSLLLRGACEAIPGGLAAYEAGAIEAGLFFGHQVRVQIGTERKRGWPARNVILAVMPAEESAGIVTPLRVTG
jgi:hypothetical protein